MEGRSSKNITTSFSMDSFTLGRNAGVRASTDQERQFLQVIVDYNDIKTYHEVSIYNGMRILDAVAHVALQHKIEKFSLFDTSTQMVIVNLNQMAVLYSGSTILLREKRDVSLNGGIRQANVMRTSESSETTSGQSSTQSVAEPKITSRHVASLIESQLEKERLFLSNLDLLIEKYCPILEEHSVCPLNKFEMFRSWLLNLYHFVKLMSRNLENLIESSSKKYSAPSANYSSAIQKPNLPTPTTENIEPRKVPLVNGFPRSTSVPSNILLSTSLLSQNSTLTNVRSPTMSSPPARSGNPLLPSKTSRIVDLIDDMADLCVKVGRCLNVNLWHTLYSYISNFDSYQKIVNKALQCNSTFRDKCHQARGSSKHSVLSLMFTPVQKLEEYKRWVDDLCTACDVTVLSKTSSAPEDRSLGGLLSHADVLSRLLTQHHRSVTVGTATSVLATANSTHTQQSAIDPRLSGHQQQGKPLKLSANKITSQQHPPKQVHQQQLLLNSQTAQLSPSVHWDPTNLLATRSTGNNKISPECKPLQPQPPPIKCVGTDEENNLRGVEGTAAAATLEPGKLQPEASQNQSASIPNNENHKVPRFITSKDENLIRNHPQVLNTAPRRNLKRGVNKKNRPKSLSDLGDVTHNKMIAAGGLEAMRDDPADSQFYSGGCYVMDAPIKLVHKNTVKDCCLYLYNYKMVIAKILSTKDSSGGEALLEVEHEVPVSDVWIAAAPTSYAGSKNLVDDTTDLSILIGWPIINVKVIFKSQSWKEDFLDNFFKCYEDAMQSEEKFFRVPNQWNELDVYQYLPLIVHNEFTSKMGAASGGSPVESNNSGGSATSQSQQLYSPAISEINVGISTRVDEVIDDTCQFSSHVPCCAWIRFGKKNDPDCYMSLHGFERLYPIIRYCYKNLPYAKRKSHAFSPCHLYITKYGKHPSDHPKSKEKPSARKISMSALIPGGVSMYKRKNSHGIHLYQPTDVSSHSNSAGVDSADCYLGDESIFGRPLTEICVNTYPPVAIRELLYAIFIKCPPIQGVFRTPCSNLKKSEFKGQLDLGNLPEDWLSPELTPYLLCDTLKDFIQHLPGGVFGHPTKELLKASSKGFLELKKTLSDIPVVNYQLLMRVVFVLSEVIRGQSVLEPEKRLNVEGLTICIAPSMFKDATHEMIHPTAHKNSRNSTDVKKLLALIIDNTEDLFSDFWSMMRDEFQGAATQIKSRHEMLTSQLSDNNNTTSPPAYKMNGGDILQYGDQNTKLRTNVNTGELQSDIPTSDRVQPRAIDWQRGTGDGGTYERARRIGIGYQAALGGTMTTPGSGNQGITSSNVRNGPDTSGSSSNTNNTATSPSAHSFDSGIVTTGNEMCVENTPPPLGVTSSDERCASKMKTGNNQNNELPRPKPPARVSSFYFDDRKRRELEETANNVFQKSEKTHQFQHNLVYSQPLSLNDQVKTSSISRSRNVSHSLTPRKLNFASTQSSFDSARRHQSSHVNAVLCHVYDSDEDKSTDFV